MLFVLVSPTEDAELPPFPKQAMQFSISKLYYTIASQVIRAPRAVNHMYVYVNEMLNLFVVCTDEFSIQ